MRLELTGRHTDITPALKRLVSAKLSKLERVLNDRAVSAQAVLTREKNRCRVDITLHARGERFLHGVGAAANWEAAVASSIEKIAQQAQKLKGRLESRKRPARGAPPAGGGAEAPVPARAAAADIRMRQPAILRAERRAVHTMSVAEAARQIGAADGLVVFRDTETAAISVLYRRSGELTLVETEV